MNKRAFVTAVTLAALSVGSSFASGCAAPVEPDAAVSDSALGDRTGGEVMSTAEPGIKLLDGYTSFFDVRRSPCVEAAEASFTVGQPLQQTTLRFVRDDAELAKELGLDASLGVQAVVAEGEASASLMRSFRGSSTNLNLLIKATQSYVVANQAAVALTPEAARLAREDRAEFLARCGDRFIDAVTYEASVEALLTFETDSQETADELGASLGAKAPVGPTHLDASLKGKLSNAAKAKGVRSSITIVARGFDASAESGLIGQSSDIEAKLEKIEQVATQLTASIRADRAKDAEGYTENRARSAVPASVRVGRYGAATNAPSGLDSSAAFRELAQRYRQTDAFLRGLGDLRHQMARAYADDIAPFLSAPTEVRALYNLAPPAIPKHTLAELPPIAEAWAARFRDEAGREPGSEIAKIEAPMELCIERAKNGDFGACHLGEDPASLPEARAAERVLREYAKRGRLVKARITVMNDAERTSYEAARKECARIGGRLPTRDEAIRLAPAVAGTIGGVTKSIWIADTSTCKYADDGMAYLVNDGVVAVGCDEWTLVNGGSRSVACVSSEGL